MPGPAVRDPLGDWLSAPATSGMGDGSYPVRIGRDADGEVTCFVADMLVLHDAEALPPTRSSTALCISPVPVLTGDRREPLFSRPGATADFLAAQITDVADFRAELRAQ